MKELEYFKLPNETIEHDEIKPKLKPTAHQKSQDYTALTRKYLVMALVVLGVIAIMLLCFLVFFKNKSSESSSFLPPENSVSQNLPLVNDNSNSTLSSPPQPTVSPIPTPVPIPKDEWFMRLINKDNPLPDDFDVDTEQVYPGYHFDARAAQELTQMITDGNATGLKLIVISGYRSIKRQEALYNTKVNELVRAGETREQAETSAKHTVAVAGQSEHNSGLGVDIVSRDNQRMQLDYVDTPEYSWLIENAHLYGFILRYPEDKTVPTGCAYEPWHYRYVGKEQALLIKESGLCLEEYLGQ